MVWLFVTKNKTVLLFMPVFSIQSNHSIRLLGEEGGGIDSNNHLVTNSSWFK